MDFWCEILNRFSYSSAAMELKAAHKIKVGNGEETKKLQKEINSIFNTFLSESDTLSSSSSTNPSSSGGGQRSSLWIPSFTRCDYVN